MSALPIIEHDGQRYYVDRRLNEARNVENPHEAYPLNEFPREALPPGTLPVTVFDLAYFKLGRTPTTGADFEEARLPIFGGCERCQATVGAYNAYPTKTGYLRCVHCITDELVWFDPAQANKEIFTPA